MGKVPIPTDELSGIPLLMAPDERALSILWGCEPSHDEDGRPLADWDHTWFPARQIIDGGDGGAALRASRVQYILRHEQHNEKNAYFDPPERLPAKPSERFRAAVLCAAGYIPLKAIAFDTDGYHEVELNDWQRTRLRESGEVRVACASTVQKFMRQFVLEQPLDHIKPKTIDQFLKINPAESAFAGKRQRELAYLLLSLAIDRVEDPLIRPYKAAYERDLLHPAAPPRPDWFIRENIVRSRKNIRTVAHELTRRLTLYREGQVATLGGTALAAA